jgi:hypothetical protein
LSPINIWANTKDEWGHPPLAQSGPSLHQHKQAHERSSTSGLRRLEKKARISSRALSVGCPSSSIRWTVGPTVGEDASDEAGPERIGMGGEALCLTDAIALEIAVTVHSIRHRHS